MCWKASNTELALPVFYLNFRFFAPVYSFLCLHDFSTAAFLGNTTRPGYIAKKNGGQVMPFCPSVCNTFSSLLATNLDLQP